MPDPGLAAPARAELKAHESIAGERTGGDVAVACWQRIVSLLENGEIDLPDEESAGEAFRHLVAVAQATLDHRVAQCAKAPSDALQRRIGALRRIRDLVMRAAIRAGAQIPSFDTPAADPRATVGVDGPATNTAERKVA